MDKSPVTESADDVFTAVKVKEEIVDASNDNESEERTYPLSHTHVTKIKDKPHNTLNICGMTTSSTNRLNVDDQIVKQETHRSISNSNTIHKEVNITPVLFVPNIHAEINQNTCQTIEQEMLKDNVSFLSTTSKNKEFASSMPGVLEDNVLSEQPTEEMDISLVTHSPDVIESCAAKEENELFKHKLIRATSIIKTSIDDETKKKRITTSDLNETRTNFESQTVNTLDALEESKGTSPVDKSPVKQEPSASLCPQYLNHSNGSSVISDKPPIEHESVSCTEEEGDVYTGSLVCRLCDKRFQSKSKLRRHMRAHTGQKPFSCTVCSKSFSRLEHLTEHLRIHTVKKPFSCTVCSKSFSTLRYLTTHTRSHAGEKSFSCTVCNKLFLTSGHLTVHMRKHTGEKPFSCTVCSKSFIMSGALTTHMRIHTGEKPFSCTVCSKSFSTSGHLTTHTRTHTGEKPFSCTVCNKLFSRSEGLNKHMRIHAREETFSCTVCSKSFSRSEHLSSHMRKHTGDTPFPCTVCNKAFSKSGYLTTHMRTHTGEKPFLCTVCSKSFSTSGHLTRHRVYILEINRSHV